MFNTLVGPTGLHSEHFEHVAAPKSSECPKCLKKWLAPAGQYVAHLNTHYGPNMLNMSKILAGPAGRIFKHFEPPQANILDNSDMFRSELPKMFKILAVPAG